MKAKFEFYKNLKTKQWHWRLRAPNGEIVASGEAFTRKASCKSSIRWIRKYAPDAYVVEVVA